MIYHSGLIGAALICPEANWCGLVVVWGSPSNTVDWIHSDSTRYWYIYWLPTIYNDILTRDATPNTFLQIKYPSIVSFAYSSSLIYWIFWMLNFPLIQKYCNNTVHYCIIYFYVVLKYTLCKVSHSNINKASKAWVIIVASQ